MSYDIYFFFKNLIVPSKHISWILKLLEVQAPAMQYNYPSHNRRNISSTEMMCTKYDPKLTLVAAPKSNVYAKRWWGFSTDVKVWLLVWSEMVCSSLVMPLKILKEETVVKIDYKKLWKSSPCFSYSYLNQVD